MLASGSGGIGVWWDWTLKAALGGEVVGLVHLPKEREDVPIFLRLREGMPIEEAVIDAGAIRFRPMLLTAMAVVVGASVMLF